MDMPNNHPKTYSDNLSPIEQTKKKNIRLLHSAPCKQRKMYHTEGCQFSNMKSNGSNENDGKYIYLGQQCL